MNYSDSTPVLTPRPTAVSFLQPNAPTEVEPPGPTTSSNEAFTFLEHEDDDGSLSLPCSLTHSLTQF